uniref:Uncharacterized protein n=1 Tax=Physcomitrium patens TaxID=3218 RepID=A0A2K1J179_PHYPA|nr:hypothetical protein PHYPA_023184 [Physcomitrium patens]
MKRSVVGADEFAVHVVSGPGNLSYSANFGMQQADTFIHVHKEDPRVNPDLSLLGFLLLVCKSLYKHNLSCGVESVLWIVAILWVNVT